LLKSVPVKNRKFFNEQTKSSKMRIIPVSSQVMEKLIFLAIGSGNSFLFTNSNGTRQTPDNLGRRFRTVLAEAKKRGMDIVDVNIHTLRKTYISHLIMAGTEPAKVMAIVGHEQWESIKHYLYLSPDFLSQNLKLPY